MNGQLKAFIEIGQCYGADVFRLHYWNCKKIVLNFIDVLITNFLVEDKLAVGPDVKAQFCSAKIDPDIVT